jgi:hypothetical protein
MHGRIVRGEVLEPIGDNAHQLGDGRQVPVDVADFHVSEVGGQRRDHGIDVHAVGVPGLDAAHHHGVPQVMHARGAGPSGRGPAQLAAQ